MQENTQGPLRGSVRGNIAAACSVKNIIGAVARSRIRCLRWHSRRTTVGYWRRDLAFKRVVSFLHGSLHAKFWFFIRCGCQSISFHLWRTPVVALKTEKIEVLGGDLIETLMALLRAHLA